MSMEGKALIIVDMQNDFISGSLAVPGAVEIIAPMQELIAEYRREGLPVFFTACWHPTNHCSFIENGGKWPKHCVAGSRGAELQCGIDALQHFYRDWARCEVIRKGESSRVEEYSGFDTGQLDKQLRIVRGVGHLFICGLARNYCVEATAAAARERKYKVTVLEELCRSV